MDERRRPELFPVAPPGRDFTTQSNTRGRGPPPAFMEVTTMSTGKAILAALRQQLNLSDYRKKHWEGTFEEYLDIVREHPEVTRTAYQRLYDMILSHGTEEVYENKEKITRYKFFTDFAAQHGDAIYRPGPAADAPGQRLQVGRQGLRHRTPRAAAARPGRQLQEHHRPPAQEGPGRVLAHRRGHALLLLLEGRERRLAQVPHARGAAAPGAARTAAGPAGPAQRRPQARRLRGHHPRRPVPVLPADVQRAPGQVRRRLAPHARRRSRSTA